MAVTTHPTHARDRVRALERTVDWRRRPGAAGLVVVVIAVTLVVSAAARPVDLAEVLLVLLVEVIGLALLAGRAVATSAAVGVVLLANWLLVPPYGTLHVHDAVDWVVLGVFLLVALVAGWLVESAIRARRLAGSAQRRERLIREAVGPGGAPAALDAFREALDLDEAALTTGAAARPLCSTLGHRVPEYPPSLRVNVGTGYEVLGWGPCRPVAPDVRAAFAWAVVRAWQSDQWSPVPPAARSGVPGCDDRGRP